MQVVSVVKDKRVRDQSILVRLWMPFAVLLGFSISRSASAQTPWPTGTVTQSFTAALATTTYTPSPLPSATSTYVMTYATPSLAPPTQTIASATPTLFPASTSTVQATATFFVTASPSATASSTTTSIPTQTSVFTASPTLQPTVPSSPTTTSTIATATPVSVTVTPTVMATVTVTVAQETVAPFITVTVVASATATSFPQPSSPVPPTATTDSCAYSWSQSYVEELFAQPEMSSRGRAVSIPGLTAFDRIGSRVGRAATANGQVTAETLPQAVEEILERVENSGSCFVGDIASYDPARGDFTSLSNNTGSKLENVLDNLDGDLFTAADGSGSLGGGLFPPGPTRTPTSPPATGGGVAGGVNCCFCLWAGPGSPGFSRADNNLDQRACRLMMPTDRWTLPPVHPDPICQNDKIEMFQLFYRDGAATGVGSRTNARETLQQWINRNRCNNVYGVMHSHSCPEWASPRSNIVRQCLNDENGSTVRCMYVHDGGCATYENRGNVCSAVRDILELFKRNRNLVTNFSFVGARQNQYFPTNPEGSPICLANPDSWCSNEPLWLKVIVSRDRAGEDPQARFFQHTQRNVNGRRTWVWQPVGSFAEYCRNGGR